MIEQLINEIDVVSRAIELHVPLKNACYIFVDRNMQSVEKSYDEVEEDRGLRSMDYYSCLISINKPVDTKKVIQSNNKYTIFVRDFEKLTEDRMDSYYSALECPDDPSVAKYKKWIFDNKEFLKNKKTLVKIFFDASVDEYEKEGKKYFYSKIFNRLVSAKKFTDDETGEDIGVPLDILMNPKKSYLYMKKSSGMNAPVFVNSDMAYMRKCILDIFKSLSRSGYDKVYIRNGILYPEKYYFITKEKNLSGASFWNFRLNSIGQIEILDSLVISGNFSIKPFYINIFAGYFEKESRKIDSMIDIYSLINSYYADEKLYDIIMCPDEEYKTIQVKSKIYFQKVRGILKRWFIYGEFPKQTEWYLLRKCLVACGKEGYGENTTIDVNRLNFLIALDYSFKK